MPRSYYLNSADDATRMSVCYLNGVFLPLAEAQIPVLDRGFIFGDGVYEVIPVFGGRPFRLAAHLARLLQSLAAIAIPPPLDFTEWTALLGELILRNPQPNLSLYIQVTRGVAPRNHAAPNSTPTVFAMASPLATSVDQVTVQVISMVDIRWQRCDIKAISLLPNVLARTAAVSAGAYEAVLFREDFLTEGAASNVFVISNNQIKTPPHSGHILPGITRDTVVEALANSPDAVQEVAISRAEVLQASEIWLTSSTRDLVPVSHLDGRLVGEGAPGPVFRRISALYERFKSAELAATR
jgi:D-alanine transaminase